MEEMIHEIAVQVGSCEVQDCGRLAAAEMELTGFQLRDPRDGKGWKGNQLEPRKYRLCLRHAREITEGGLVGISMGTKDASA